MSMQDQIVQLILGRGNVLAEQAKEAVAQQEIQRRNKHRILNGTLRALATFGPLALNFIPGVGPFLAAGAGMATRGMYNDAGVLQGLGVRQGNNPGSPILPGIQPGQGRGNGFDYSALFRPQVPGYEDLYPPWDQEGVG